MLRKAKAARQSFQVLLRNLHDLLAVAALPGQSFFNRGWESQSSVSHNMSKRHDKIRPPGIEPGTI